MSWLRIVALAGFAAGIAGCQSPGAAGRIGPSFFDETASVRLVLASMPEGQHAVPPGGFIGFCVRHPEECAGGTDMPKDAVLTAAAWSELNQVNDYVNRTFPQVSDLQLHGRDEWWAYPTARGGDCEDLALMKRKLLIERGWAAENLLLAVVHEWNGDGHAVLVVKTDRGEFVLDNKNWEILAWSDAPYRWIKRQSRHRPYIWVNLDKDTFRNMQQAELPALGTPAPFLAAIQKKSIEVPHSAPAEDETASPS